MSKDLKRCIWCEEPSHPRQVMFSVHDGTLFCKECYDRDIKPLADQTDDLHDRLIKTYEEVLLLKRQCHNMENIILSKSALLEQMRSTLQVEA